MTAAPHLSEMDLIERLLGRDDLTVDDVADLPGDLRYELIDGRLVVPPAAMPIHQNIGYYVMGALKAGCPADRYVSLDQSVVLNGHDERRPDVVVVRIEGASRTPLLVDDVMVAVEIISRSSRFVDREIKVKDYAQAGIPAYWIIDPLADRVTLTRFVLDLGAYRQTMVTDERVTIDEPWTVTLDLPAWTRERDRLQEVARPDR